MMKRSTRLRALLKIAAASARERATAFAGQRRLFQEKSAKLEELRGYLGEYQARFAALTRAGAQAGQIRSAHAFVHQLEAVIAQQQQAVADAERGVEEHRHQWLEAKRHADILQKTVERMRREEMAREHRTEQALADEVSGRRQR